MKIVTALAASFGTGVLVVCVFGCSDTPPDTGDAASDDAQPVDEAAFEAGPPPRCDITKPFSTPTADAVLSLGNRAGYAFLSSDELTAYVSADIFGTCSQTGVEIQGRGAAP